MKEKPKSATKNRHQPGWEFRQNAFRDASDPSYNNLYVGLRAMPQEPPSRVERRLSAILAADVAGYSRLMHSDEESTHAKLTALLTDAVNPAIAEHGGRIVKNTGDGFLAEFPSAVAAVRAAIRFQTLTHELTSGDAEDRRLRFRVGINIGDVIVEPHDVFGDGVNIAARLESIAEPGGICISSSAYDQVLGKITVEFVDLGTLSPIMVQPPRRNTANCDQAKVNLERTQIRSPVNGWVANLGAQAGIIDHELPRDGALFAAAEDFVEIAPARNRPMQVPVSRRRFGETGIVGLHECRQKWVRRLNGVDAFQPQLLHRSCSVG